MSKFVTLPSETNPELDMVEDASPGAVNAQKDSIYLVDVRSADEYAGELGHIKNSKLITLDMLMDHIDDLPKDQTIVFICRSGRRSANAAAMTKDNGFESVYNMQGGMLLWNEMGLDTEGKNS